MLRPFHGKEVLVCIVFTARYKFQLEHLVILHTAFVHVIPSVQLFSLCCKSLV